jgi:arylamine N-acetyltransferase
MSSPAAGSVREPELPVALVERVLAKLGFSRPPARDLAGLNALYAALCSGVPFDNIQKRIWFARYRHKPSTGGDPAEFFENWVNHGTGATCWPLNGGMYALARALGFRARRTAGSVIVPNYPRGANHGSVLVAVDGIEYVFDVFFGAFRVLPFLPGQAASVQTGIHALRAVPRQDGGCAMYFRVGWAPMEIEYLPEPEHDPVPHSFFLARYDNANQVGFFNTTLLAMRRFPDSVITVGRGKKIIQTAAGMETTGILETQRNQVLIEQFGLSPEIVALIPPDTEGGTAPF